MEVENKGDLDNSTVEESIEKQGEAYIEDRITQLSEALRLAKSEFEQNESNILLSIFIWSAICSIIVVSFICFFKYLFNICFPLEWSWQIMYYTLIRITALSALFSLSNFSFKMLSSHIQLYRANKHCIVIIGSIPSFVESGRTPDIRDDMYKKLVSIVTEFRDIGVFNPNKKTTDKDDVLLKVVEHLSKGKL